MARTVLLIDCCVHGDQSRTLKLARRYLDTLEDVQVNHQKLYELDLAPLSCQETVERKRTDIAKTFAQADEIVVAAPYWDLSFPSILKVYLEHVCVTGITFHYVGYETQGLCKAKKAVYISTAGGFVGAHHLGEEYIQTVFQAMFSIPEFHTIRCEGLDLPNADPEALVAEAAL